MAILAPYLSPSFRRPVSRPEPPRGRYIPFPQGTSIRERIMREKRKQVGTQSPAPCPTPVRPCVRSSCYCRPALQDEHHKRGCRVGCGHRRGTTCSYMHHVVWTVSPRSKHDEPTDLDNPGPAQRRVLLLHRRIDLGPCPCRYLERAGSLRAASGTSDEAEALQGKAERAGEGCICIVCGSSTRPVAVSRARAQRTDHIPQS